MEEGLLIALEGIDGSGHSTQAKKLRAELEANYTLNEGNEPLSIITREPTEGPIGGEIKECLANRLEIDHETLALMFAADRRDHVENELKEWIDDGKIVISDRYILSSLAYQGVYIEDRNWILEINSKSLTPDLTILLDVPANVAKKRREKDRLRSELFEKEGRLEEIRQEYKKCAELLDDEGHEVHIVNGDNPEDKVTSEIYSLIYDRILDEDNVLSELFTQETSLNDYY